MRARLSLMAGGIGAGPIEFFVVVEAKVSARGTSRGGASQRDARVVGRRVAERHEPESRPRTTVSYDGSSHRALLRGERLMLIEGEPTTVAATDRLTLQRDLIQYDGGDGPCVKALGGEMIRIGFLEADQRFPHFAAGAADRRVNSVLSTPAIDHGQVVGSLDVYSHHVDASTTAPATRRS